MANPEATPPGPLAPSFDEWPRIELKRLVSKIGSGATPIGGSSAYLAMRFEWSVIRTQDEYDRYFNYEGLAFISVDQAYAFRGPSVARGDVLLNITGDGVTFGRACLAPVEVLPACVNQHVAIIRPLPSYLDSDFLLAYLTHPQVKSYIESFNAGGSRRAITKGHIESFVVPLPELWEQQAIGSTLRALDDKIIANHRMNRMLQEMAATLFEAWFNYFDRAYSYSQTTSKRPGSKLHVFERQSSELDGNLPAGWKFERLGSVMVNLRRGIEPSTLDRDTPYIGLEHMPRNSIALSEWGRAAEVESTKLRFKQAEILFR